MPTLDMIGVNNRNLATFEVSLDNSKQLSALISSDFVKISESGITSVVDILDLESYGFKGFLVGENFMKTDNAGKAASDFIKQLQNR